jgi:hypothetical protein
VRAKLSKFPSAPASKVPCTVKDTQIIGSRDPPHLSTLPCTIYSAISRHSAPPYPLDIIHLSGCTIPSNFQLRFIIMHQWPQRLPQPIPSWSRNKGVDEGRWSANPHSAMQRKYIFDKLHSSSLWQKEPRHKATIWDLDCEEDVAFSSSEGTCSGWASGTSSRAAGNSPKDCVTACCAY